MPNAIQDALLIYNPISGRQPKRRFAEIEQAVRLLKDAGICTKLAAAPQAPEWPKESPARLSNSAAAWSSPAAAIARKRSREWPRRQ